MKAGIHPENYRLVVKPHKENQLENGRFFVNADNVTTANMMPATGYDNLKAAFGTYTIKEAILVVNPNGPGEEYDLIVSSSGADWSVMVDFNGNITQKIRD